MTEMAGLRWRKSTASHENGDCVELAPTPDGMVAVRHSKHPEDGALLFTRAEIGAWLAGVRAGEFDDLA